ncbi:Oxysterol-binding protein-related protein 8 [Halotydeus destructor]|nr:Oxysterol-binding protein-related protein 8 [Halotydeus destructor]
MRNHSPANQDSGSVTPNLPPVSSSNVFLFPSTPTGGQPPAMAFSGQGISPTLATDSSAQPTGRHMGHERSASTATTASFMSPGQSEPTATGNPSGSSLTKRESYKDRKKTYQLAKKKVAEELLSTIGDPTIVVLADWLKVRGTLKGWTKVWCELKPGLIVFYKSPKTHKSGVWIATVLLNVCEVIERPSKKDGFCFKLFHPLQESIWASRGPKGESFGAIIQPLPDAYLICRAPSEEAGKRWMEAMELSYRASSLLVKNSMTSGTPSGQRESINFLLTRASQDDGSPPPSATLKMNESEIEKHFQDHDLDDEDEFHTDEEDGDRGTIRQSTDSDSDITSIQDRSNRDSLPRQKSEEDDPVDETPYCENTALEEFGSVGDQTEEVAEENKGLLWTLLKQVRPGMDLSKVVLPTFILEPRSFLEKLGDYYYHSDILAKAAIEDDPFIRMKQVVQWYLSGFYKKPKGLKKPYNPILGETFRCYWNHDDTKSRTFFISEQVSHHPPVSAFYITNRKDGFAISGSVLAKSKFYGNSVSAILDGTARLSLLTRGEDYTLTMPYAHCKGILMGNLSLEYGGKVEIRCDKTGYYTEMEFKLKPFLGGSEYSNLLVGKIKLGKETLASVDGHWDVSIKIKDKKTGVESVLWEVTPEVKSRRLKRYTVPIEHQDEFESEKLWRAVSVAILRCDQVAATEEKTILEEEQRRATKERAAKMATYETKHFVQDILTGEWIYKQVDSRPWDARTDVLQFERDYVIQTKTRHKTPTVAVRTNSVVSIETAAKVSSKDILRTYSGRTTSRMTPIVSKDSGGESSSPESKSVKKPRKGDELESNRKVLGHVREMAEAIKCTQQETLKALKSMEATLELINKNQQQQMKGSLKKGDTSLSPPAERRRFTSVVDMVIVVVIALVTQLFFSFIANLRNKNSPK